MIRPGRGNLLTADADALVNTVNTVGVMGKGIALQFKKAFPANFRAYRAACAQGEVVPGRVFVFETGRSNPRLIVNFPTKRHWRDLSRLEDVQAGLADLVRIIQARSIRSIAVPPLGAGNGGLHWGQVRPLIVQALAPIPDLDVVLFEPGRPPLPEQRPVAPARMRLTAARAAILAVFEGYLERAFAMGRLEAQKLVYLLRVSGQPIPGLEFAKARFGPYAETLNQMLSAIDGHLIRGFGDRATRSEIVVLPDAREAARRHLDEHDATRAHVARVLELIEGYEGLYGMELLATVHWVAAHDLASAASAEAAVAQVQSWSSRKRDRFSHAHIEDAWQHLASHGWLRPRQHAGRLPARRRAARVAR